MVRAKKIVRISVYGILVNLALAGVKAAVGFFANSISVLLDAVNNLTDVLSSVVTIIGTKLSEKKPDKKHPFGHGRAEYFSAIVVAIIVLFAGGMALFESIEKIVRPVEADYSVITLAIILATVVVKFVFGRYVLKQGRKLDSGSLEGSGVDAISDAALSLSVFVGAVISLLTQVSLEGYIGILIGAMIVRTAVKILREGVDDMLGTATEPELVQKIRRTVLGEEEVISAHDIVVHNYGPSKKIGSVHIEVDEGLDVGEVHRLSREIEAKVLKKYGVVLSVGIYATNDGGKYKEMREKVLGVLKGYEKLKGAHGFYVDEDEKVISFDVVFLFEEEEPEGKAREIREKVSELFPEYEVRVVVDADM